MKYLITTDWKEFIDEPGIKHNDVLEIIENEDKQKRIFPGVKLIFTCFNYFNRNELKVVVFGQDPYHGCGQANGLAFSVNENIKTPSSLFHHLSNKYILM